MSHQHQNSRDTSGSAAPVPGGAGTPRDIRAFTDVVHRSYGPIYLTALAIVRDRDIADDIAQETFLRAWLKLDTLRDATLMQPWLARIARNIAAQWLRTGQQRSRVLPLISMEEITVEPADNTNPNPRQAAGQNEQNAQLTDAVMALPDDLRQAVLLHYAEGMSPSDIARLNGEAPSTITRRLDRARDLLRQHLESGLAASLAASVQPLRPTPRNLQRALGITAAAAALPAATRAQLLQQIADTPPPPTFDPITSAATAAPIEEAGIMKSIIAKTGAAKLLAGGAAVAAFGGAVYGVNQLTKSQPATQPGLTRVEVSHDKIIGSIQESFKLRRKPGMHGAAASQQTVTATTRDTEQHTEKNKPSLSDRIAVLKNDLVSTQPTFIPDDGKTSAGIYLNLQVVDGSGFPIEGATLQLYKFMYDIGSRSGMISVPSNTSGTIGINGYTLEPKETNASGIARIMVPQYTLKHLTTSFSVRATHPDYTATFADIDLTSVTKIVMTGGYLYEVIPVDAATSKPILTGVTPIVESDFSPDWEQRSDGTIAFRKISGDMLLFFLKYRDPLGRVYLSGYQKVKFPLAVDNKKIIALTRTSQVRGKLSPNVPRPIKNGTVRAQASVESSCTKFGWQEVDVAEDGTFLLTDLPSGDILVSGLTETHNSARPRDNVSTDALALPQSFRVTSNIQDYELPMAARGNLRIHVVDTQHQPVDGARIVLTSQISFNNCSQRWEDDKFAVSDTRGYAEIAGVPAAQNNWLYVTDGWQLKGEPVGMTGLMNRVKGLLLGSGETLDITLTVEPATD